MNKYIESIFEKKRQRRLKLAKQPFEKKNRNYRQKAASRC